MAAGGAEGVREEQNLPRPIGVVAERVHDVLRRARRVRTGHEVRPHAQGAERNEQSPDQGAGVGDVVAEENPAQGVSEELAQLPARRNRWLVGVALPSTVSGAASPTEALDVPCTLGAHRSRANAWSESSLATATATSSS